MKTEKTPIAVFASGRGSNFDSILAAVTSGKLAAEIVAVVSDQPSAPVITKAGSAGIPTIVVPWDQIPRGSDPALRRGQHEQKILEALRPLKPRFVVMAGYMRIVTGALIGEFRSSKGYSRIVNIHPSLLPEFPGVDAYRRAFESGARVAGVTVHLVEAEVDSGPICAQESFAIGDCRDFEEVERRGLAVEHRLFPETLRWVLREEFEIEERQGRLFVRPN